MGTNVGISGGTRGSREFSEGAYSFVSKTVIEGASFNGRIAKVYCTDTNEAQTRTLRFTISLAENVKEGYVPRYVVMIQEKKGSENRVNKPEHFYFYENLAAATKYSSSAISDERIAAKQPLKMLYNATKAITLQLNYELPRSGTPEADQVMADREILQDIELLAKTSMESKSKIGVHNAFQKLLRLMG
jgi:hypothetical protein